MKNTIRCCISCILPCGALDVIRVVHSNGRVEEIFDTIKAEEILKLHPKHVLKKPTSSSIVIVPPDSELQRGKIYFLIPVIPVPNEKKKKKKIEPPDVDSGRSRSSTSSSRRRQNNTDQLAANNGCNNDVSVAAAANNAMSDQYLSEILSDKASTFRDRRRGRVGIWRPHLESICETPIEAL